MLGRQHSWDRSPQGGGRDDLKQRSALENWLDEAVTPWSGGEQSRGCRHPLRSRLRGWVGGASETVLERGVADTGSLGGCLGRGRGFVEGSPAAALGGEAGMAQ